MGLLKRFKTITEKTDKAIKKWYDYSLSKIKTKINKNYDTY